MGGLAWAKRHAWLLTPRTTSQAVVSSALVFNPAICAGSLLVHWPERPLASWLAMLVIAETVTLLCVAGLGLVRLLEIAIYQRRRVPPPKHGIGWSIFVSMAFVPIALPVGYAARHIAGDHLGVPWHGGLGTRSYFLAIGMSTVIAVMFFFQRTAAQSRDAARAAEARLLESENARLRAQLSALSAEMNPHLLFNALNTVAALVHGDPDAADRVIVNLGELYRGVLRSAGRSMHVLEDELRLCRAYLEIERARFGERLRFDLRIDPDVEVGRVRVPVLILQPLVENAVRHGIGPRADGGAVTIHICDRDEVLEMAVEDDGVGLGHSPHAGNGKAVENCRLRLALAFGPGATLALDARQGGGTRVAIRLPRGVSA